MSRYGLSCRMGLSAYTHPDACDPVELIAVWGGWLCLLILFLKEPIFHYQWFSWLLVLRVYLSSISHPMCTEPLAHPETGHSDGERKGLREEIDKEREREREGGERKGLREEIDKEREKGEREGMKKEIQFGCFFVWSVLIRNTVVAYSKIYLENLPTRSFMSPFCPFIYT